MQTRSDETLKAYATVPVFDQYALKCAHTISLEPGVLVATSL